jgi:hypothetical protein
MANVDEVQAESRSPAGMTERKATTKAAKRLPGFGDATLIPCRFAEVVPAVMSAHQLSGFRIDGD